MTDKELKNFFKDSSQLPTSGWISKTDNNGRKEWNHYRFYDTSRLDNSTNNTILKIALIVGIIAWIAGF